MQDFVDDYKNSIKQIVLLCEKICDSRLICIPSGVIFEVEELKDQLYTYVEEALRKIIAYYNDIYKYFVIIHGGFQSEIIAVRN